MQIKRDFSDEKCPNGFGQNRQRAGITSPTNRQNRNRTAGNSQKWRIESGGMDIEGGIQCREMDIERMISAEKEERKTPTLWERGG